MIDHSASSVHSLFSLCMLTLSGSAVLMEAFQLRWRVFHDNCTAHSIRSLASFILSLRGLAYKAAHQTAERSRWPTTRKVAGLWRRIADTNLIPCSGLLHGNFGTESNCDEGNQTAPSLFFPSSLASVQSLTLALKVLEFSVSQRFIYGDVMHEYPSYAK